MKNFYRKTVFIPGGSSGIGLSAAKFFSSEGADVFIFARDGKKLEAAEVEIRQKRRDSGQKTGFLQIDVSDHARTVKVLTKAVREFGVPDILINCAGRAYPNYFEDISYEQFDETMKNNLYGTWNTCSFLVPLMKEKGGYIVNTSSMGGFIGLFGLTDYCASKFAVIGFSEVLRSEVAQYNISVSVLCPPDTDTPGFKTENITKPDELKAVSASTKILQPDVVAAALIKGMKKNSFVIIPGADSKIAYYAKRYIPGLVNFIMNRDIQKVQKRKK